MHATNISKREKVLISLLLILVVVVGFMKFLLLPLYQSNRTLEMDLEQLQTEYSQMQLMADEMKVLPQQQNTLKASIAELNAIIPENQRNYLLDSELTTLATKHGLTPVSFDYTITQDALSLSQEGEDDSGFISSVTVAIKLTGSSKEGVAYLDALNQLENSSVTTYSFVQGEGIYYHTYSLTAYYRNP